MTDAGYARQVSRMLVVRRRGLGVGTGVGGGRVFAGCALSGGRFFALVGGQFPAWLLLRLSFFLFLRLLIDLNDGLLRIFDKPVMRIALQEFLECRASLLGVVQVVLVDFANGEKGVREV